MADKNQGALVILQCIVQRFNGFHVQEEDSDADADVMTSEGIFVFDGNSPAVDVQIGDLVRVEGLVSEFNGLTEITSFTGVTVLSSENNPPPPLPIEAQVDGFFAGLLADGAVDLLELGGAHRPPNP